MENIHRVNTAAGKIAIPRLVAAMVGITLVLSAPSMAEAANSKQHGAGIQNYTKNSPFTSQEEAHHLGLSIALYMAEPAPEPCAAMRNGRSRHMSESNVCLAEDVMRLKESLAKLAPTLDMEKVTFWKTDLESDYEPELLVGYRTQGKARHQRTDSYLTLWLVKLKDHRYEVSHGGPFLAGRLHAVKPFGPFTKQKTVFIQYLSCTGCYPTVYLAAINFGVTPHGAKYLFTYSEGHISWNPTIEYKLPGGGYGIDADVETRIPKDPNGMGPHLIQRFYMEAHGLVEWWIFTCRRLKCDYHLFLNDLPVRYKASWRNGEKL